MNPQLDAIATSLRHLFPSVRVDPLEEKERGKFLAEYSNLPGESLQSGQRVEQDGSSAKLWFELSENSMGVLHLHCDRTLSAAEIMLLEHFPAAMRGLIISSEEKIAQVGTRIATQYAFEHILVAHRLAGSSSGRKFWTEASILQQLLLLSVQRYEGEPCTSGFAYVPSEVRLTDSSKDAAQKGVEIERFDPLLELRSDFFSSPASYRYVDGSNAFYLIDNRSRILGIARIREPNRYGFVARASHEHLHLLRDVCGSESWVAYVGERSDINVIVSADVQFRWVRGHWQHVERALVRDLLVRHGVTHAVSAHVENVVFSASTHRRGALILVPNSDDCPLAPAGAIDRSPLRDALLAKMQNRSLDELIKLDAILGVVTSDGMTRISKTGVVLGCGEIIRLSSDLGANQEGGSRTQAAIAASRFGVAVKVSEDGPISVYENGKKLLQISY